jgi:hypothetical protein
MTARGEGIAMKAFIKCQLEAEKALGYSKEWVSLLNHKMPHTHLYTLEAALKRPEKYIVYVWSLLYSTADKHSALHDMNVRMAKFNSSLLDGSVVVPAERLQDIVKYIHSGWHRQQSTIVYMWLLVCLMATS